MFFNMEGDLRYSIDIFQIFCKPEAHLKRAVNRKRPKVRYEILCTKVLDQVESTARVTRSRTKPNHLFQSNSHVRLQKSFGDRAKVVAFTIYGHLK